MRMKKKIMAAALCVAMAVSGVVPFDIPVVNAASPKEYLTYENQIPEGYTAIYDVADLYAIRNNTKGKYILMNDLDMSEVTQEGGDYDGGSGWVPIETFSGTLDGNGYRIIGMHIRGGSPAGLFKKLDGATVENLGIEDCDIDITEEGYSCVGALSADAYGTTIINCYTSGSIKITWGSGDRDSTLYVGGMIGMAGNVSTISNCYNACSIKVDVSGSTKGYGYCGGLIGETWGSLSISSCYNSGVIESGEFGRCGALTGHGWQSDLNHCCYLKGTAARGIGTSDNDGSNVVSLTEAQMRDERFFTGFDFEDSWEVDPYCSYPYPMLQNSRMVKVDYVELVQVPKKLVYDQGDTLEIGGAILEIHYEDGITTQTLVDSDMLDGYDMNKFGNQTVTVGYRGAKTSFEIEVRSVPVTDICVEPQKLSIYRSQESQLTVKVLPENASYKSVVWSSDKPDIVSVDGSGRIKANTKGTATVTAKSSNGLTAKCVVTVCVPAVKVQLSKSTVSLMEGKSDTVTAQILPLESTDTLSWVSDDQNVAKVYDGTIVAIKEGTTEIRAYTESGVTASCFVSVTATPTSEKRQNISSAVISPISAVTYNERAKYPEIVVRYNGTRLRSGYDYTVAYTNNVNVGTARVTITGIGKFTGIKTATFNILKASQTISGQSKWGKMVGDKKFSLNLKATNGAKIIYRCSNTKVAKVDSNGKVTIKKAGSMTITASVAETNNFKSASKEIKITVIKKLKPTKIVETKRGGANGSQLTVKWKKMKGISGYEVRYSLNSSMVDSVRKKASAKKNTVRGFINPWYRHYAQIRTYKIVNGYKCYSKWSKKYKC